MFQIVFNTISAAEMSELPRLLQLELLEQVQELPEDFPGEDGRFRQIHRDGRTLVRVRTKDHRLYVERIPEGVLVHRVLSRNTLDDFLFRSKLPMIEDTEESDEHQSAIWQLVEEAEQSGRKS